MRRRFFQDPSDPKVIARIARNFGLLSVVAKVNPNVGARITVRTSNGAFVTTIYDPLRASRWIDSICKGTGVKPRVIAWAVTQEEAEALMRRLAKEAAKRARR